eukprot:g49159.t1
MTVSDESSSEQPPPRPLWIYTLPLFATERYKHNIHDTECHGSQETTATIRSCAFWAIPCVFDQKMVWG